MFFNAWMVQYILLIAADETRNIHSSILGPYQSLRNIVVLTVYEMDKDTKKTIALLFILSILISIIGFVLTNMAVIPVADTLSRYLLQFAILNVIETIYSPFFLVCLFLTFISRPFHIDDDNILHF
jgi:cation transporter-like permease